MTPDRALRFTWQPGDFKILRRGDGRQIEDLKVRESCEIGAGAPPIPASVPPEQLPFVGMRAVETEEGMEPDIEFFDTRTGESIPSDSD
jgi:hypothetical protein